MNASKERLRTALSHREPDRPPMMMSASKWVIARLKKHVGVETDRELHRALGLDICDTRGLDGKGGIHPRFVGPEELSVPADWTGDLFEIFNYHEVVTENEYGKAYSLGTPCFGADEFPTIDDLEKYLWPQVDWFDFSDVRPQVEEWADEFAIMASGASIFQHATFFRGIEQLLLEMAAEPERAEYILGRVGDFYLSYFERFFEEAGDLIDVFRLADDIGAQDNLFVSPRMLDRFLGERIHKCADLAHAYDIRLLFHSDGNIYDAIPRLIEWGIDILDPVQPEVPAMNHRTLKREFGDRISFSGGIGAQKILPRGSVEDVKEETRRTVADLGAGGGYILSPGHPSLQMDVPLENIVAMYETGLEMLCGE